MPVLGPAKNVEHFAAFQGVDHREAFSDALVLARVDFIMLSEQRVAMGAAVAYVSGTMHRAVMDLKGAEISDVVKAGALWLELVRDRK